MIRFSQPPALVPGDRVAVIVASSPCNQTKLAGGVRALEAAGLVVDVLASATAGGTEYDYLAGDDVLRATDLTNALADPAYAGIFMAGGGYGAQRTLELVDWSRIDPARPKVVVGYSDVTALLEAIAVKLGWGSFFGPMVACDDFHQGAGSYAFDTLMTMVTGPVAELRFPDARTIVPGVAEGVTLGGNASLLAAGLGTDTSLPAEGAILFLEDVDEFPFRMDRIITQLRRSVYTDGVAGILLGTFTECGDPRDIERMLVERFSDLGVPVLAGADIGHNIPMQTYPIGVPARLDADAGTLTLLKPAVS
ncbi:LD-carboxypeptidase [Nonomuraea sp. NBC_01738]|uniref:S66 peptidase family protein n=1 Tax=Nonomuraea sp. NBC_01738 TaxID=2976003 RepID=UPI002E0FF79F|nr:LD-carboxypeptidase [Nonomuraea sp. NBC_01738]